MKRLKKKNQNRRPHARNGQRKKLKCLCLYGKKTLQNYNLINTPDVRREISTKVSEVGNGKSVKQCKLKLRNIKASCHDTKLNNDIKRREMNQTSLPFMRTLKAFLAVGKQ